MKVGIPDFLTFHEENHGKRTSPANSSLLIVTNRNIEKVVIYVQS